MSMSDVEGVVLLGNRDDLSAVLTIRGHANFSLLKRRDRVRNRRKELMKNLCGGSEPSSPSIQ